MYHGGRKQGQTICGYHDPSKVVDGVFYMHGTGCKEGGETCEKCRFDALGYCPKEECPFPQSRRENRMAYYEACNTMARFREQQRVQMVLTMIQPHR